MLHFVDRNPGLTVADLLDILKITKQSLARVLKELVDSGFIEQRTGPRGSPPAAALCDALRPGAVAPASRSRRKRASRRRSRALGPSARDTVTAFLFGMIDAPERPKAARLVAQGRASREPARAGARPESPPDDAPHLLVVDDDMRIRTLLTRFLGSQRFSRHRGGLGGGGAPASSQASPSTCSSST